MNFFIMVSLFLSAALGVFRGIDLALLTDAETGLFVLLTEGLLSFQKVVDVVRAKHRSSTNGWNTQGIHLALHVEQVVLGCSSHWSKSGALL